MKLQQHHWLGTVWKELRRRKVFQVAFVYTLMGWGVMQVGDIRARHQGHLLLITLCVTVDPAITMAEGHAIAHEVEHRHFGGPQHTGGGEVRSGDPGRGYEVNIVEDEVPGTIVGHDVNVNAAAAEAIAETVCPTEPAVDLHRCRWRF